MHALLFSNGCLKIRIFIFSKKIGLGLGLGSGLGSGLGLGFINIHTLSNVIRLQVRSYSKNNIINRLLINRLKPRVLAI